MLKTRLIATLLLRDGLVVQSIGFDRFLPIGRPGICIEFLSRWGIDEIILLDIAATPRRRTIGIEFISEISHECFVPLTTGGGLRDIADIEAAVLAGSEKIAINSAALEDPSIIDRAAGILGKQCIVASIDVRRSAGPSDEDSSWRVFGGCGKVETSREPAAWARELADRGAGEILINSIDRDGGGAGYDIDLLERISSAVQVPVIALGGVGRAQDFVDGICLGGATAVAAGNIFHHTEHAVVLAKEALRRAGVDLRLASNANYTASALDRFGRVSLREPEPAYPEHAEEAVG